MRKRDENTNLNPATEERAAKRHKARGTTHGTGHGTGRPCARAAGLALTLACGLALGFVQGPFPESGPGSGPESVRDSGRGPLFGATRPFVRDALALERASCMEGPLPLPLAERGLPTETAEPVVTVSDDNRMLEGALFDNEGNFLFCDTTTRRVLRLDPAGGLTTVRAFEDEYPCGLAFGPDGRLYIVAGHVRGGGSIIALDAKGTVSTVLPRVAGYQPNDLVFDAKGGFYFTDFRGDSTHPDGGVFYVPPERNRVLPVLTGLCKANGVALSPDGTVLYVTEFARNALHMLLLQDATTVRPTGSFVAYRFTGPAPDSMRVDAGGNVYVANCRQGRVQVFSRYCIPVGQILIPGRDREIDIRTTSLALRPGTRQMYIVTGNDAPGTKLGSRVYKATALANGLPLPSPPRQ